MDLSVIIVSWNVWEHLEKCLASIYNTRQDCSFEVIVVDNASADESVVQMRSQFPQVKVIENNENVGFPIANNQGIAVSQGEFVLLLNPDTLLSDNVLSVCVKTLREKPEYGGIGCRLTYADGRVQLECGRRLPNLWDILAQAFYLNAIFPKSRVFNRQLMPNWDHSDERDVECLSGAFMMFRKHVLDEVGYLDKQIFMYLEDVEICFRFRKNGWKLWFLGTQTVIHTCGRSSIKADKPLWLLEGEVKSRLMKIMYGEFAARICRVIIGARSAFRLAIGALFYLPALVANKVEKQPDLFDFMRNIRLIHWSVNPAMLRKYFAKI